MTNLATAAAAIAKGAPAFASVTLWCVDTFFLQVHHGYFSRWEDAEEFGCRQDLSLIERAGALYLVHGDRSTFIPDAALLVFRSVNYAMPRSLELVLDDLLDVIDVANMRCIGLGHMDVVAGEPIIARELHAAEFAPAGDR